MPPAFTLVSCSAYCSTPKMEVICSSETSTVPQFRAFCTKNSPSDRIGNAHSVKSRTHSESHFEFTWGMNILISSRYRVTVQAVECAVKACNSRGGKGSCILNLGPRWMRLASCTRALSPSRGGRQPLAVDHRAGLHLVAKRETFLLDIFTSFLHKVLSHLLAKHQLPLKPAVSICTTCFNTLTLRILPTEGICVFRMVLTINSDCFPKQH
jgi:hypothetical protein